MDYLENHVQTQWASLACLLPTYPPSTRWRIRHCKSQPQMIFHYQYCILLLRKIAIERTGTKRFWLRNRYKAVRTLSRANVIWACKNRREIPIHRFFVTDIKVDTELVFPREKVCDEPSRYFGIRISVSWSREPWLRMMPARGDAVAWSYPPVWRSQPPRRRLWLRSGHLCSLLGCVWWAFEIFRRDNAIKAVS